MPRHKPPKPGDQNLPVGPPSQDSKTRQYKVLNQDIGNEDVTVIDYLVVNGVVTSERRERKAKPEKLKALRRSQDRSTFAEWEAHIHSLAE